MAITGFSFGQTIQACDVVTWHFGDGTTASVTGSPSTSHVYAAPGRYSIAVEIRNSMGSGVANSVMFWIANGFVLPAELTSVPENGGVAHVMVMKTTAPDAPGSTSVAYHTRDGSPGVRYTSTSGVLTFAADETQKSVDIPIIDNSVFDGDAYFYVDFDPPANNYAFQYGHSSRVNIIDDDKPTISFTGAAYDAVETSAAQITLVRAGGLAGPTTATLYASLLAGIPSPLSVSSVPVSFASNETSKTVSLPLINDEVYEGERKVRLMLDGFDGGPGPVTTAVLTVADDEPQPVLSISDVTVWEGNSGTHPAELHVSLTGKVYQGVDVNVDASGGTATANTDYALPSDEAYIHMSQDQTSLIIPVNIIGDMNFESDETFFLTLSSTASSYVPVPLFGPRATCTILNDDVTATADPPSLQKGSSGKINLAFGGTRPGGVSLSVTSSDSLVVTVPATVPLTSASSSAEVPFEAVGPGTATISVALPPALGGGTARADVTVEQSAALSVKPSSLLMGIDDWANIEVRLDQGPGIDVTVLASSTNAAMVSVPPRLTIPGNGRAVFKTSAHASSGSAVVSLALPSELGGGVATLPVMVTADPSLTDIWPREGSTDGGTLVRLTGTALRGGCWPFFDGLPASNATVVSSSTMTGTAPPHGRGSVAVAVRCSGGRDAALSDSFTYTSVPEPAPVITAIEPLAGPPGLPVTVSGIRFSAGDRIIFGTAPAPVLTSAQDAHTVRIPQAPAEVVAVTLVDPLGRSTTTGPIFRILPPATVRITSVTPPTTRAGAEVIAEGSGFCDGQLFDLGTLQATVLSVAFDRVAIRLPAAAQPGTYSLDVLDKNGVIAAVGPAVTITASGLRIDSITPSCATTDGSVSAIITGAGFGEDSVVTIGEAVAKSRLTDAGTIVVTIPPGHAGTFPVTVTDADGSSASLSVFRYYSPYDPRGGCGGRRRPARR